MSAPLAWVLLLVGNVAVAYLRPRPLVYPLLLKRRELEDASPLLSAHEVGRRSAQVGSDFPSPITEALNLTVVGLVTGVVVSGLFHLITVAVAASMTLP